MNKQELARLFETSEKSIIQSEIWPKIKKHHRIFLLLIWMFAVWQCGTYIVKWQPAMEAKIQVIQSLNEQGIPEWSAALMQEMKCFPVKTESTRNGWSGWLGQNTAISTAVEDKKWYFENSYGDGRSYGGERKHEGIDIMSADGDRGILQIQSVSDGIVEQIGWLKLGGYRVGIRSNSGLYYYYAHLDRYASGLEKGDTVKAGTILGYMGDTGYGEEGTRGKFSVHLHFGIYYDKNGKETSLNPYDLLKVLDGGES